MKTEYESILEKQFAHHAQGLPEPALRRLQGTRQHV